MQQPREELEADDGVDDDDKHHEERDVEQGDHGHQDGIQYHLQAFLMYGQDAQIVVFYSLLLVSAAINR